MVYEQPHVFFWNYGNKTFNPNRFIEIDIEAKIRLYELLESQVRSFRSPEHIRALAKIRGGQANMNYAEAFEIIRWC